MAKMKGDKQDVVKEIFDGEEIEVVYTYPPDPTDPSSFAYYEGLGFFPPLNQRTYEAAPGIICEQDVACTLRDGVTIYSDIYRPKHATEPVPVILAWSFYGKRPFEAAKTWQIVGVPPGAPSNMVKFEGPDPSYWCNQGYAVANVDGRGCGNSEGDLNGWGEQEGRDMYDYIEWIATLDWCNGNVGMNGNSGLAMSQWFAAAEQPPHLAAIAPWEGSADLYREFFAPGGIPDPGFSLSVMDGLRSTARVEDFIAMAEKYPLINEYWESKRPKLEKIKCPVYMTASWCHTLHLRGAFQAWRRVKSRKKWMRAHREFEWQDLWTPANEADLKLFFDRYLKGIHNGWEFTPKVRLEVMDVMDLDYQTNRPEREFPLARTEYKKLFLDANKGSLSYDSIGTPATVRYDGNEGKADFDFHVDEDTELTGYFKAVLYVEAEGNDDMDLFCLVQKFSADGEHLGPWYAEEPHPGCLGLMRVSQRALDEDKTTEFDPVQSHQVVEKLRPGQVVEVQIEFFPHSRIWHPGEILRLSISGHFQKYGWWLPYSHDTLNQGTHVIHTGGKYQSYLQVPYIPPKYQVGDFIIR